MTINIKQISPAEILVNNKKVVKINSKWTLEQELTKEEAKAFSDYIKSMSPKIDNSKNYNYWQRQSEYVER